jgi:hypothetical protein
VVDVVGDVGREAPVVAGVLEQVGDGHRRVGEPGFDFMKLFRPKSFQKKTVLSTKMDKFLHIFCQSWMYFSDFKAPKAHKTNNYVCRYKLATI